MNHRDPGWLPILKRIAKLVALPWLAFRRGTLRELDGLSTLRTLFVSFVVALSLFLLVLRMSDVEDARQSPLEPRLAALVVAGVGAIGLAAARWVRARPLKIASERELADSYRQNFFLGIAFTEAAALVGLAGSFLTGRVWVYLVGFGFSLLGFGLMAPTRRDVERRQREIHAAGSTLPLQDALLKPLPRAREQWRRRRDSEEPSD